MSVSNTPPSQRLTYGWGSLWRAHAQLPRELTPKDFTVYVRAINREAAKRAMDLAFQSMFPGVDLDEAYYNLHSAHELIEQGLSEHENDRLFETSWHGNRVCDWVQNPVFVVPDADALFEAWSLARERAPVTQ